jgi:hypothetical protein
MSDSKRTERERAGAEATVALCTVGRPSLESTLAELRAGGIGALREVLVVDNGRDAVDRLRLAELLAPLPLRVLPGPGPASAGRNLALAQAVTDVVLFLDDDCLPARNWAAELAGFMAAHRTVAAGYGAVEPVPGPGVRIRSARIPELGVNAWGEYELGGRELRCPAVTDPSWEAGISRAEPTVPWCVVGSSNNMALRRSLLLPGRPVFLPHLGPGTGAGAGEDTELGYALMAAGRDVAHVPSARVLHDSWMDLTAAERAHRGYFRGNVEALGEHVVGGDPRAGRLLQAYLTHFCENNEYGFRHLGEALEWAYGDHLPGRERTPLRKSDLVLRGTS